MRLSLEKRSGNRIRAVCNREFCAKNCSNYNRFIERISAINAKDERKLLIFASLYSRKNCLDLFEPFVVCFRPFIKNLSPYICRILLNFLIRIIRHFQQRITMNQLKSLNHYGIFIYFFSRRFCPDGRKNFGKGSYGENTPLHDASVQIVQLKQTGQTDEDGNYEFENVPPDATRFWFTSKALPTRPKRRCCGRRERYD